MLAQTKKLLSAISFLLIFWHLSGLNTWAQAPQPKSEPAQTALLYEISGRGMIQPSYLFGTIHVICPEKMFPTEKYLPYFRRTDRLVLEIDLDDPATFSQLSKGLSVPPSQSLNRLLPPAKFAKVDKMFKDILGVSVSKFKNLNPTALSSKIMSSPVSLGCEAPGSYEVSLLQLAVAHGKPIDGVETVTEQITALSKTSIKKQAEELYNMSLNTEKAFAMSRMLTDLYISQDSGKIAALMNKATENNKEFQISVISERNKKWIPRLEAMMAEKPSFIAVGAGHLEGPDGVVGLLRKSGFTVTPIRF